MTQVLRSSAQSAGYICATRQRRRRCVELVPRMEASPCESRGNLGKFPWRFCRKHGHCQEVVNTVVESAVRTEAPKKTMLTSDRQLQPHQKSAFAVKTTLYLPINFPTYSATAKIFSSCSLLPTSCRLTCAPSYISGSSANIVSISEKGSRWSSYNHPGSPDHARPPL